MITRLEQFAGNRRTVTTLQSMLAERRVPQALVIEGPVGSGRKTLARLLAAGLLCEHTPAPCGTCAVCRKVAAQMHPDVTAVTPLAGKAAISVDQIRQVRSDAFVRANEGRCKIFIIQGTLNDAAQNAFLKILEEPPAGVTFIILCVHRSELMDTVLSRAVVLPLAGVTFEEAVPVLTDAGIPADETARERLAKNGGILGSLIAADDRLSAAGSIALAAGKAIADGRRADFLRAVCPAVEDRTLYAPVLNGMLRLLRDAMILRIGLTLEDSYDIECTQLLAGRFTGDRLLYISEQIKKEQEKLLYNPNGWLFFTALCAGIFPREG